MELFVSVLLCTHKRNVRESLMVGWWIVKWIGWQELLRCADWGRIGIGFDRSEFHGE